MNHLFLEPVTEYGVSKAAATLFCQSYAATYNLPIVTLRLFSPLRAVRTKIKARPFRDTCRTAKDQSADQFTPVCEGFYLYR